MRHYATLRDYKFQDRVDDIRGCELYGVTGQKLGKIDDVIFEHGGDSIKYAVVDTGGWLGHHRFLVPARRIHSYDKDPDALQVDLVKEHIERYFPPFDEKAMRTDEDWRDYDNRYEHAVSENKVFEGGPVLHREGSSRILTPEASEMPVETGDGEDLAGYDVEPQRIAGKFTPTMPGEGKETLQPAGSEDMPRAVTFGNEAVVPDTDDYSRFGGKSVTDEFTPSTLDDAGVKTEELERQSDASLHEHGHEGAVADRDTRRDNVLPFRNVRRQDANEIRETINEDLRGNEAPIANVTGHDLETPDLRTMQQEIPPLRQRDDADIAASTQGPGPAVRDTDIRDSITVPESADTGQDMAGNDLREMRIRNMDMNDDIPTDDNGLTGNPAGHSLGHEHALHDRNDNRIDHPVDDVRGKGSVPVSEDDMHSTPSRWKRFEDLLRRNRVDIEAKCPSCAPAKQDKRIA